MKYYVYILFSSSLNKYYVGSSKNVLTRLDKHLQNHKGFTGKVKDCFFREHITFESKYL